jgi:hypothetical protein
MKPDPRKLAWPVEDVRSTVALPDEDCRVVRPLAELIQTAKVAERIWLGDMLAKMSRDDFRLKAFDENALQDQHLKMILVSSGAVQRCLI